MAKPMTISNGLNYLICHIFLNCFSRSPEKEFLSTRLKFCISWKSRGIYGASYTGRSNCTLFFHVFQQRPLSPHFLFIFRILGRMVDQKIFVFKFFISYISVGDPRVKDMVRVRLLKNNYGERRPKLGLHNATISKNDFAKMPFYDKQHLFL